MKIRRVALNNHRRSFEITAGRRTLSFPYAKADPSPSPGDPVRTVAVDQEVGREAFLYTLESGASGEVHVEQVLEYNRDPAYMRELLLYRLTIEAQRRLAATPTSKREIIRRLGTSASQFYRLIDQTNYKKSIDQMVALLTVLDCDVDVVVRIRESA